MSVVSHDWARPNEEKKTKKISKKGRPFRFLIKKNMLGHCLWYPDVGHRSLHVETNVGSDNSKIGKSTEKKCFVPISA